MIKKRQCFCACYLFPPPVPCVSSLFFVYFYFIIMRWYFYFFYREADMRYFLAYLWYIMMIFWVFSWLFMCVHVYFFNFIWSTWYVHRSVFGSSPILKTAVPLVLRQFCSPAYLLHKTQHSKDTFVCFYWNFGRSAFDFSLQIPISLFLSPNGRLPGGRPS